MFALHEPGRIVGPAGRAGQARAMRPLGRTGEDVVLLDPRNLGLTGFVRADADAPAFHGDLRKLQAEDGPGGATLEKRIPLEPGYARLRIEGPAPAAIEVEVDDVPAHAAEGGFFMLPPVFAETALLRIRFAGPPSPVTGLWLVT